ncbi:orf 39 [Ateline gammaherpesvirus 3]|uniref:Orf 39 n=1 Tax=Ateline herpesvirus 3 TaxID=85618 RepID=Q9YTM6_ATHV3|nr:orf 39 [Ateline gammaherpesvirus 3]AAC95565.1 orf 39 [Ateline gammaherpesvirus 3]
MNVSRSDTFMLRSWIQLLVLFLMMFVMSAILPMAASVEGLGFPCYFPNLVNYSLLNLTLRNAAKHLTPTLFLEAPELFVYITWSVLVDLASAIYYVIGAVAIFKARKTHVTTMRTLQTWIHLVGSHTMLFIGLTRMWTLQLFIHVLSYKHVMLAAFIYCIHFCLSYTHSLSIVSRNSPKWSVVLMEQHIPKQSLLSTILRYGKPVCVNMYLSLLAVEMLVFALGVMMAIGNSFYILVSDTVLASINLYFVLTTFWYMMTEIFLHEYIKLQLGFYLGVYSGSLILLLPLLRYEHVFVSANLHRTVAVNIAMVPATCVIAMMFRIFRYSYQYRKSRNDYKPVPKKLKKRKQTQDHLPIMTETSDEDF